MSGRQQHGHRTLYVTCCRGNYLWLVCVRTVLGWILTSWVLYCTTYLSTKPTGSRTHICVTHGACLNKIIHTSHVLTGKGSAPSWITKPSMRCVRTLGLTTAWGGGALSLWETLRDTESTVVGEEDTGGEAPKSFAKGREKTKACGECEMCVLNARKLDRLKCL